MTRAIKRECIGNNITLQFFFKRTYILIHLLEWLHLSPEMFAQDIVNNHFYVLIDISMLMHAGQIKSNNNVLGGK